MKLFKKWHFFEDTVYILHSLFGHTNFIFWKVWNASTGY